MVSEGILLITCIPGEGTIQIVHRLKLTNGIPEMEIWLWTHAQKVQDTVKVKSFASIVILEKASASLKAQCLDFPKIVVDGGGCVWNKPNMWNNNQEQT